MSTIKMWVEKLQYNCRYIVYYKKKKNSFNYLLKLWLWNNSARDNFSDRYMKMFSTPFHLSLSIIDKIIIHFCKN